MPVPEYNKKVFKSLSNAFEWQIDLKENNIYLDKNFWYLVGIENLSHLTITEFRRLLLSYSARDLATQLQEIKEELRTDININLAININENHLLRIQFNGNLNKRHTKIKGLGLASKPVKKDFPEIDFRAILSHCEEGIIILDNNENIIDANTIAMDYTDQNLEQLKGSNIKAFYKTLNPVSKFSSPSFMLQEKTSKEVSPAKQNSTLIYQVITRNEKKRYLKIKEQQITGANSSYKILYLNDVTDKKKAEARSFLHSVILHKAPVAITFTNTEGKIQFVNPAFSKITGYDFAEIKSKNPRILQSGVHTESFYQDLWTTIKSGKTWEGQMQNKKKNGELYWEKAIITPHVNEDGELEGFIKVAEDITKQTKTEQKLKKSEIKYRDVFETAGVGIIYINKEGQILDTNQKFNELFNNTDEPLKNISAIEFINNKLPRSLAKELLAELFHIIKGNRIPPKPIQVYDRFYEIQSDYNPDLESNIGIIRDITDKKRAEQKLKKSEAKYRYLVDNMNDGLAITDKTGEITFMNPAAELIFEVKPHEVGSKKLTDVAVPSSLEVIKKEEALRKKGKSSTYYIDIITRKKSKRSLEIYASPIYDAENNFNGSFAIIRDITEKILAEMEIKTANSQLKSINKKLQEHASELEFAKDKAEESEKLKSAFLANISHEIRTPMNGIVGFAQLAMNSSLGEEKRTSYLQIVSESTLQLESVVMDIIDLSKIESGESKFAKKTTEIKEIIENIYETHYSEAREKGIKFNMQYDDNIPKIKTDPARYKQVVKNLTHNALKFTSDGVVTLTARIENTNIAIIVKDTGIGIPDEYHEVIFEPFRQVEQALKRRFGGTGLGLTIARKIARNLNGNISLQSAPGQGSTFTFRHPLS